MCDRIFVFSLLYFYAFFLSFSFEQCFVSIFLCLRYTNHCMFVDAFQCLLTDRFQLFALYSDALESAVTIECFFADLHYVCADHGFGGFLLAGKCLICNCSHFACHIFDGYRCCHVDGLDVLLCSAICFCCLGCRIGYTVLYATCGNGITVFQCQRIFQFFNLFSCFPGFFLSLFDCCLSLCTFFFCLILNFLQFCLQSCFFFFQRSFFAAQCQDFCSCCIQFCCQIFDLFFKCCFFLGCTVFQGCQLILCLFNLCLKCCYIFFYCLQLCLFIFQLLCLSSSCFFKSSFAALSALSSPLIASEIAVICAWISASVLFSAL